MREVSSHPLLLKDMILHTQVSSLTLEGSSLHWLTRGTLLLAPWGPPAASGSLFQG